MPANIKEKLDIAKKFQQNNDFANAIETYKYIIKSDPENFEAWFNLGMCLKDNEQTDNAIIAYQKALSLNSDSHGVYRNLGNIYYIDKNDPLTTIDYYKKLVELEPYNNEAKICLAVAYLKTKNYKEGWNFFEARLNDKIGLITRVLSSKNLSETHPLWQGEDIKDKTVYVYYEGGIGDTIMFSRFLHVLKTKCKKVLFRPQLDCYDLFKENFKDIEVINIKTIDDMLDFDVHIPLMSLPYRLEINEEKNIPCKEGYMKADDKKVKEYKQKYFNDDKFKIGIKWQGNTNFDTSRKIMLTSFSKLFTLPDTVFYSLQKDDGMEQLDEFKDYNIIDLGKTFNNLSDTSAAIENLDLVICNDTSIGHLAGALSKPCRMLLPFVQDWRWSTDLSYCLWYNSIKFFQQKEKGNWEEVFERMYSSLKDKIDK